MEQRRAVVPRSLGICVTTRGSARHVLGLAGAAARAGIDTEIFLTSEGVHLPVAQCGDGSAATVCSQSTISSFRSRKESP